MPLGHDPKLSWYVMWFLVSTLCLSRGLYFLEENHDCCRQNKTSNDSSQDRPGCNKVKSWSITERTYPKSAVLIFRTVYLGRRKWKVYSFLMKRLSRLLVGRSRGSLSLTGKANESNEKKRDGGDRGDRLRGRNGLFPNDPSFFFSSRLYGDWVLF